MNQVPALKQCPSCKREGLGPKPATSFYRNLSRYDGLSPSCIEHHGVATKASAWARRLRAIALLGGRCVSGTCAVPGGMADPRALQFDHVEGNGAARRRAGE